MHTYHSPYVPKRSLLLCRKIHNLLSYAHGLKGIIINPLQRYNIFGIIPNILPKKLMVEHGVNSTRKQKSFYLTAFGIYLSYWSDEPEFTSVLFAIIIAMDVDNRVV